MACFFFCEQNSIDVHSIHDELSVRWTDDRPWNNVSVEKEATRPRTRDTVRYWGQESECVCDGGKRFVAAAASERAVREYWNADDGLLICGPQQQQPPPLPPPPLPPPTRLYSQPASSTASPRLKHMTHACLVNTGPYVHCLTISRRRTGEGCVFRPDGTGWSTRATFFRFGRSYNEELRED